MEKTMRTKFMAVASIALMGIPTMVVSTPADARAYHSYHGRGGHYNYYRHRCSGGNGAVGTIAGGVGGALIGNALGGGTLGTIAGGVGGGLLGRHLDKAHTRHRNGC
jgi:outer membrane lipoprotein SlyB